MGKGRGAVRVSWQSMFIRRTGALPPERKINGARPRIVMSADPFTHRSQLSVLSRKRGRTSQRKTTGVGQEVMRGHVSAATAAAPTPARFPHRASRPACARPRVCLSSQVFSQPPRPWLPTRVAVPQARLREGVLRTRPRRPKQNPQAETHRPRQGRRKRDG